MPGSPQIGLYDATIGVSKNALNTLLYLITKAQSHPDAADLASARLYPDMLPFSSQVIFVSSIAKKSVERLTNPATPLEVWEDTEKTFDELVARIHKTLALLETVKPEDVQAKEQMLQFAPGGEPVPATTVQYVLGYALPNLMFHVVTAYDILRSRGVELGKRDYLKNFVADFMPKKES